MRSVLLIGLGIFAWASESPKGSCGAESSPECLNDMGSCGNACCAAEFASSSSPPEVYNKIVAYLKSGGSDGLFKSTGGAAGLELATPDGAWTAIFQGMHTTFKARYNDTVNFAILRKGDGSSVVRVFSISNVAGALGDEGQNRRTVSMLAEAVGLGPMSVLFGCGAAPSLPALSMTGIQTQKMEATVSLATSSSSNGLLSSAAWFIAISAFMLGVVMGRWSQKP